MPILVALQVADGTWPPYASMMLIELYEMNTKQPPKQGTQYPPHVKKPASAERFAVRLIYNGKVLNMPFCSSPQHPSLCDYSTLAEYMTSITPSDDYAKECSLSDSRKNTWKWQQ